MSTRRDFIRQAVIAAGVTGISSAISPTLLKALGIDPEKGSSFYDAEHVVILMQENRSFDHCFGSLQGVRGFNDPRAVRQPNGNKVWLQTNRGHTYAPFRLNIKDTKSTWMGSLPHSWDNMVDALNDGKMDQWLEAKKPGNKAYEDMPLTMGFNTREDIPFYYALADAFTLCDQHFCSSLTATIPNRLHLWTGTVRPPEQPDAFAHIRNSDIYYDKLANWRTFPERLEEQGISWKIYQNELSLHKSFTSEEDAWLCNYEDNPIEWFEQYNVFFKDTHQNVLRQQADLLKKEIAGLASGPELDEKQARLQELQATLAKWSPENFEKLSAFEKNLHMKAFVTNEGDPDYRTLADDSYDDNGTTRQMKVPAGDVLYQFRKDTEQGQLPTVSWIVSPERFSDHPSSPWYGAWYISEVMNILTKDPGVWKKTIFIITYDENDGYFDHIPPFAPPVPGREETGKVSANIDIEPEFVRMEEELYRKGVDKDEARENSIGLGFRVPLIIASPWTRGGRVNSEVFDHTSVLQFLEKFLSKKTGKHIEETNISAWRRTVCGDLRSVFSPYHGEPVNYPKPVDKPAFIQSIHKAQFKALPSGYRPLEAAEIDQINQDYAASALRPEQEPGIRDSCALPYQMLVSGALGKDHRTFNLQLSARNMFGERSAGVPYRLYARDRCRNYALRAGDSLTDTFMLGNDLAETYELEIYGPNGFFRKFRGTAGDPALHITDAYALSGQPAEPVADQLLLVLDNREPTGSLQIQLTDQGYGAHDHSLTIEAGKSQTLHIDTVKTHGWYDFIVSVQGYEGYSQHFAGRVETGAQRKTDPIMGRPSGSAPQ